MVTFTKRAVKVISNIMNEQKVGDDTRVRVGVKGGGCSGFTYTVDFDSKKGKFDLEFESFGLNILVDKKSHIYIKDTEVNFLCIFSKFENFLIDLFLIISLANVVLPEPG